MPVTIFFVGGIYGAGKSSLCRQLSAPLRAEHVMASELIQYAPDPDDATRKSVANVAETQERLLLALEQRKRRTTNMLLDGHFCVLDPTSQIVRISLDVFRAINPAALLLVEAEPDEVKERLEHREARPYDLDLIKRLAAEERSHAEYVSSALLIPLKLWWTKLGVDEALRFLMESSSH